MKKKVGLIFCLLLFLLTTGCSEPTAHAEKENYTVGEEIILYDDTSNAYLGRVKILDVSVIKDGPFVIHGKEYAAIVRMTYTTQMADSQKQINAENFVIYDAKGHAVQEEPQDYRHENNTMVFAVQEKGEYVVIHFRFSSHQETIVTIIGEYEEGQIEAKNETLKAVCIVLGEVIAVQIMMLLVFKVVKRKLEWKLLGEDEPREESPSADDEHAEEGETT